MVTTIYSSLLSKNELRKLYMNEAQEQITKDINFLLCSRKDETDYLDLSIYISKYNNMEPIYFSEVIHNVRALVEEA